MRAVSRLNLVVDFYGRSVAQLEYSRRDNLVARIDAGNYSYLIATRSRELDDLLAHATVGIAFSVFEIGNDEN